MLSKRIVMAFALLNYLSFIYAVNDDSFIHLRYVKNLMEHGELRYNPGEKIEGITNLGYVLLFLPFHMLGILGDKILNLAGYLLLVSIGYTITPLLGLLFALDPASALWASHGLETIWVMIGILLLIYGTKKEKKEAQIGAALIPLMRTDLIWIPFIVAINKKRKDIAISALLAALFITAFRIIYYGSPIPFTYVARSIIGTKVKLPVKLSFIPVTVLYFLPWISKIPIPWSIILLIGFGVYGPASAPFGYRYISYFIPIIYYFFAINQAHKNLWPRLLYLLFISSLIHGLSFPLAHFEMIYEKMGETYNVDASFTAGTAYFSNAQNFLDLGGLHSPHLFKRIWIENKVEIKNRTVSILENYNRIISSRSSGEMAIIKYVKENCTKIAEEGYMGMVASVYRC